MDVAGDIFPACLGVCCVDGRLECVGVVCVCASACGLVDEFGCVGGFNGDARLVSEVTLRAEFLPSDKCAGETEAELALLPFCVGVGVTPPRARCGCRFNDCNVVGDMSVARKSC